MYIAKGNAMRDGPDTRASLILRLGQPGDAEAWARFVEIYEPLVLGLIRNKGIQHADAIELTQEVMLAVMRAVDRWDPDPKRGSFRGWLATIARNLMINFLASPRRRLVGTGSTSMHELLQQAPDPRCEESRIFDLELERRLFSWAAEHVQRTVRASTWRAFWETTIDERSVDAVADELDMTPGAVYVARCRVMRRLRECVESQTREGFHRGEDDDATNRL